MKRFPAVGRRTAGVHRVREIAVLLVAVALDVLLFSDAIVGNPPEAGGPRTSPVVVFCCAGVCFGLLLFRHRARMRIFLALCAISVGVSMLASYRPVIPVCIALASVVAYGSSRRSVAAVAAAVATCAVWVYANDRLHDWSFGWSVILGVFVFYLAMLAVSAGIGWWRQSMERLNEERRAEAAREAITVERRRVARELHDIVAHAVTLMVLQASGARAVMPSDPARADAALQVVEKTGSQAMSELRRLLGVLRAASVEDGQAREEVELPPGLDDLPGLLESVRAAGVEVTVRSEGAPRPIDRSVDAAAYRIVSESLTNVTKHSGSGAAAEVQLRWRQTQLEIDVLDNGRGTGPDERLSTGNGLLGLTERIVLVGGAFQARPRDSGGYEVHATLPLPAADLVEPNVSVGGG